MNHRKRIGIFFLTLTVLALGCKPKEKENRDQDFLSLFFFDQTTGSCATITKNSTGTMYTASGSNVPKSGCNAESLSATFYTTSPAIAKAAVDTFFDGGKAVFDAHSACTTFSTALTTAKGTITEATIAATQSTLTSGVVGCTSVGSYPYRVTNSKWIGVQICKDEASIAAVKALTAYQSFPNVSLDMASSLTNRKTILASTKSTNGFTDAQIQKLEPHGTAELNVFSGMNYLTYFLSKANVSCAKQIVESDSSLKTFLAASSGLSVTTGIEQSDVSSVSILKTNPSFAISCGYGNGFTANTTTAACPGNYPSF